MASHFFLFSSILIVPYVLLGVVFVWAIRSAVLFECPVRPLVLCSLAAAFTITAAFVGWGLHSIATSRSSMAAVGYVFLPVYSVGVAAAAFAISWSVGYLLRFILESLGVTATRVTSFRLAAAAVLVLLISAFTAQNRMARHRLLAAVESVPPAAQHVDHALASHDVQVLARLARNRGTSVGDLVRIYESCKGQVTAAHPRDYLVFFSLARNPKTPPEILRSLSQCKETSVRLQVGLNPSAPVEVLTQLAGDREAMVRTWVTANPSLPTDLLRKLMNDNDRIVRDYAQSNLRHRGTAMASPSPPSDQ